MTTSKNHIFLLPLLLTWFFVPAFLNAAIIDLGTHGHSYKIEEPDALNEIRHKAAKTDWSKVFDKEKLGPKIKNFKLDSRKLPRTKQDRTFSVDMTYRLERDIPDGKGGILYPAGYSFNPLDYMDLNNIIVVIDATDREQIEWYKKSNHAQDYRTMLLITDGNYFDLMEELDTSVYYATIKIIDRFNLQNVPAVVSQAGKYIQVEEIYVNEKAE